jgi:hypothetical protein
MHVTVNLVLSFIIFGELGINALRHGNNLGLKKVFTID